VAIYATPHAAEKVVSTPVASQYVFSLYDPNGGGVTTGCDNLLYTNGAKVEKVMLGDRIYIIRDGVKYTITGVEVK
jgi:hypothetical protein